MADISQELENIKNAEAGEDVRMSIYNGIDKVNKETVADNRKNLSDMETIAQNGINSANNIATQAKTAAETAVSTANQASTQAAVAVSTANAAKAEIDEAVDVAQAETAKELGEIFLGPKACFNRNLYSKEKYSSGDYTNSSLGKFLGTQPTQEQINKIANRDFSDFSFLDYWRKTIDDDTNTSIYLVIVGIDALSANAMNVDNPSGNGLSWRDNRDPGLEVLCFPVGNYNVYSSKWASPFDETNTENPNYKTSTLRKKIKDIVFPEIKELFGDIFANYVDALKGGILNKGHYTNSQESYLEYVACEAARMGIVCPFIDAKLSKPKFSIPNVINIPLTRMGPAMGYRAQDLYEDASGIKSSLFMNDNRTINIDASINGNASIMCFLRIGKRLRGTVLPGYTDDDYLEWNRRDL